MLMTVSIYPNPVNSQICVCIRTHENMNSLPGTERVLLGCFCAWDMEMDDKISFCCVSRAVGETDGFGLCEMARWEKSGSSLAVRSNIVLFSSWQSPSAIVWFFRKEAKSCTSASQLVLENPSGTKIQIPIAGLQQERPLFLLQF